MCFSLFCGVESFLAQKIKQGEGRLDPGIEKLQCYHRHLSLLFCVQPPDEGFGMIDSIADVDFRDQAAKKNDADGSSNESQTDPGQRVSVFGRTRAFCVASCEV